MENLTQSKKSGRNFIWFFVVVCFLLVGAVFLNVKHNRNTNLKKPNNLDLLVSKWCSRNNLDSDGKVYDCGNYYVVTPSPLTSDMPSSVINKSGELIVNCGGLMQFTNDEERLKHSELCSQYTYTNCGIFNCQK